MEKEELKIGDKVTTSFMGGDIVSGIITEINEDDVTIILDEPVPIEFMENFSTIYYFSENTFIERIKDDSCRFHKLQ